MAADVAHEGSHVADKQDAVKQTGPDGDFLKSPGNVTVRASEQRAYGVTAAVLAGLPGSKKFETQGGAVLFDPKALPGQRGKVLQKGLATLLSGSNPLYPTSDLNKQILEETH